MLCCSGERYRAIMALLLKQVPIELFNISITFYYLSFFRQAWVYYLFFFRQAGVGVKIPWPGQLVSPRGTNLMCLVTSK